MGGYADRKGSAFPNRAERGELLPTDWDLNPGSPQALELGIELSLRRQ